MTACERKTNNIAGLDKKEPLKIRKQFKTPESTSIFPRMDNVTVWTNLNTADNSYAFDVNDVPSDPAQCETGGCPSLSGTLVATNTGITTPGVQASLVGDFSALYNGVLRVFIETANVGDALAAFTLTIADTVAEIGVNDDVYTFILSNNAPDYESYTIDLSQTPDSSTGTGWDKTNTDTVAFTITADLVPTGTLGFSNVQWYESPEDLASPELLKLYCIDGLSNNRTYETIDNPCDDISKISDKALEFSVTVQAESVDVYKLMPDVVVDTTGNVLKPFKTEKTVESFTDPNTAIVSGAISLQSITTDICVPVDVIITTQCLNGEPPILRQLQVLSPDQEIPIGFFHVVRGEYDTVVDNKILINSTYIGQTACADYYNDVEGTKISETNEFAPVLTSVYWDYVDSDNKSNVRKFDDAVLTAFNEAIGQTDPLTFEITMQVPATNGVFTELHKANS